MAILAAVAREPARRDAAAAQRIRDRLATISNERERLQQVLAAEFPDYAALSNPAPLAAGEIQALLAEELVLLFASDTESYVFALTRKRSEWRAIPIGAKDISEKVTVFRRGLDVEELKRSATAGNPVLFDLGLAHELYVALLGPVEALVKDKRHLLVVPTGALTSLPFGLLVTEKPAAPVPQVKRVAAYRDAAWLIKRQAVTVMPSVASLKALRAFARKDFGTKPLVGFGDPI